MTSHLFPNKKKHNLNISCPERFTKIRILKVYVNYHSIRLDLCECFLLFSSRLVLLNKTKVDQMTSPTVWNLIIYLSEKIPPRDIWRSNYRHPNYVIRTNLVHTRNVLRQKKTRKDYDRLINWLMYRAFHIILMYLKDLKLKYAHKTRKT